MMRLLPQLGVCQRIKRLGFVEALGKGGFSLSLQAVEYINCLRNRYSQRLLIG